MFQHGFYILQLSIEERSRCPRSDHVLFLFVSECKGIKGKKRRDEKDKEEHRALRTEPTDISLFLFVQEGGNHLQAV